MCKDVKTEPELLPVGNVKLHGTTDPKARPDVSAVGIDATDVSTVSHAMGVEDSAE